MSGVPWRKVLVVLAVAVAALSTVVVVARADGFPAVDATVPRATRWFVHQASGRVVLADGFSGKALARLDVDSEGDVLDVAQSPSGVALLDRSAATARPIDASALRLGPPQSVSLIGEPSALVGFGQLGLVAVDPDSSRAVLVPSGGGEPVPFEVPAADRESTFVAPDGGVWTLDDGTLSRFTSTTEETVLTGLDDARFRLVGNLPFVLDEARGRARWRDGDWVTLPEGLEMSELVMQQTGPRTPCGWLGVDDRMICIDEHGIAEDVVIEGLDIDGADLLAVAGEAAALIRRSPSEIVRIDWRAGRVLDDVVASVPAGQPLNVSVAVDLIWVDQPGGSLVWAIHPWGINVIAKDDDSTPLLGETGEVLEAGSSQRASTSAGPDDVVQAIEREPDNNGIDDPPVAIDDPVTARTGAAVPIVVTANDYDPDGEAVVLNDVGSPTRGTAEIASASTVVYRPESGYVGLDRFEYTIVDGNGTPATATVTLELLPVDATNRAPIGTTDHSETGAGRAVIVDVLLNDIDPERDALRIHSFDASADVGGRITETVASSNLPGLLFEPPAEISGTATFTYQPADSFGAVGDPVVVRVDIAQASDDNRPPIVQPDAVRLRHDIPTPVPVLANDRDPDGDRLQLGVLQPLPPGIEVVVRGDELVITARAGAAELVPLTYTVDDGNGNVVPGPVLVAVIGTAEPNRPPIANADLATAVAGRSQPIDVLLNDSDPDGDQLVLASVTRGSGATAGEVSVQGNVVQYTAAAVVSDDEEVFDRFTYVVVDGNGNEAIGDVTVRVLPERIAAPPFAKDDSATTQVDVPVTLDVLRNDGDPSGERPSLVGTPGCLGLGTAVVAADERVTYHPPPGQTGVFRCTYEVTNSVGLRASASIVVNVVPPVVSNQPPTVVNEEQVVTVGQTVIVDVLANDSDPDGPNSALRVVSSTTPTIGTANRSGGVITFSAGTVTGVTTIIYQVGDDDGGLSTGRLMIRVVDAVPQAPIAVADRRTIRGPGTPTTVDVLANDNDPDGLNSAMLVTSATLTGGTGSVQFGSRTVTFVPDPTFVGDMVATYVVQDISGLTGTATATLTILEPLNRPPVARDDAAEVVNGGTVTVPIALNDEDPDGNPLTYSIVSSPDSSLGSARLTAGGQLAFEAVPGASGVAVVGYRVDDGRDSATANVRITVLACAVAPPEAPDLFFQTGYQQPIAIDLGAHARNGQIVDVGPPLGAPSGVYTPPPGENGNVTFTYVVRNACRIQRVGTVVIDVNQDPVASPYRSQIGRINPVTIPVSALASDAEPLVITALESAPAWIAIADPQTIRIDPAGRSGSVGFVAVVADPGGLTARVQVTIDLINLAPVAHPDSYTSGNTPIVLTPLVNDVDPDGDAITLQRLPATVQFENGITVPVTKLGEDRIQIDPAGGTGLATFTYTARDALGLESNEATITLRVNRPPTASDVNVDVSAGASVQVALPASDPDGNTLTATLGAPPTGLTVSVSGLVVTITAAADAEGVSANIPYTVTDGSASASATLSITVTAPTTTTSSTTSTTSTTVPTPDP